MKAEKGWRFADGFVLYGYFVTLVFSLAVPARETVDNIQIPGLFIAFRRGARNHWN